MNRTEEGKKEGGRPGRQTDSGQNEGGKERDTDHQAKRHPAEEHSPTQLSLRPPTSSPLKQYPGELNDNDRQNPLCPSRAPHVARV